jgi:hypothetical protein
MVPLLVTEKTTVEPVAIVCGCGWIVTAGAPVACTARTAPLLVTTPPAPVTVTVYEPALAAAAELMV